MVSTDWLERAITKLTKAELVEFITEIARTDSGIKRRVETRFELEVPACDLVEETGVAIADATDFDEREINRNFSYDDEAYSVVKNNFGRLVDLGYLREAMELSLELISERSYQVEMSDEGLMTEDIQECLRVVIKALRKSDLPAEDVSAWCAEMVAEDRVGFICQTELRALQDHLDASHSR